MRRLGPPIVVLLLLLLGLGGYWLSREAPEQPREHVRRSQRRVRPARQPTPRDPDRAQARAPALPAAEAPPELPLALPVTLDTGAPDDTADDASATLVVSLTYPNGAPIDDSGVLVYSDDCQLRSFGWDETRVFETTWTRCTVRARRRDGALFARSDELTVELEPGQETFVTLILPSERTGGLGVQIAEDPDGIRVVRVLPGSPAEEMGLEEGDLVVEVDGLPTDALTMDEFISVMTGPEGSEVDFVLGFEADTGWTEEEMTLTRASIN